MTDDPHILDPEILAELDALGEDPPDHNEAIDAAALADVLNAVQRGPEAIEALDADAARDDRLQPPLAGLHLLRATAGEDSLSPDRRDALWANVSRDLPKQDERPPAKVIPLFQRPAFQATFAIAAALILAIFLGVFASIDDLDTPTGGSSTVVAQVELDQAEARLLTLEKDSLKALMSAQKVPSGPSGDHYLRDLRQARFDAVRARRQARARRL